MNHARLSDNEEPEIVVIGQNQVVINTGRDGGINGAVRSKKNNQQNNKQNRVKDPSNNELLSMTLATNAVVDLGD